MISAAKNALAKRIHVRPEGQGDDYDLIASEVFPRYQAALRAQRAVDFDDLIALPVELLRSNAALRQKLQDRYRYLLVDEYQDTNRCQLELLKLVAGPRMNVCAVGDDDQAIYGWRGAEVRNILRFDRHFPGAKEVRLEQNYRSTGRILACANAVIAKNPHGAADRMLAFVDLVERYAFAFDRQPLGEVARRLVAEVDLYTHARAGVKSAEAGQRKVDAIDGVLRSVEGWVARTGKKPTLRNYLASLALDSREEEPQRGDGVALMTLHAAKGLEFPVVFLTGMEEDLLPCSGIQGEARDLDEERRLAYVGITRARERLFMTRAQARLKRGKLF